MILVTGSTGYLGSHLLYELVKSGKSVKAMFRSSNGISRVQRVFSYYEPDCQPLLERIEWIQADILDNYSLNNCMKGISQVYHVAGFVSFNNKEKRSLNRINITGTANVVNSCMENGVGKLCHVSSIAALGEVDSPELVDEKLIWKQSETASAYSRSKFLGEMEVWRGIYEGLNAVIVNPSVIIGPGMWLSSGKQIINQVQKGLKYYPSGTSGYVDVRDVARVMVLLTEGNFNKERYIINSENIPHRYYLNLIADALDKPRPDRVITPLLQNVAVYSEILRSAITGIPARIDKQTLRIANENLAYSNDKVRKATGISFISIEESVNTAIKLYLKESDSAS